MTVDGDEGGVFDPETEQAEQKVEAVDGEGREYPRARVGCVVADRDEEGDVAQDAEGTNSASTKEAHGKKRTG